MNWHLLPNMSAPMPFQMALDEVLFRRHAQDSPLEEPILRFFESSEPWVTIGYTHREPVTDSERVCRRITGGGRVNHGKDLIFSLIAKKSDDESFGSVRVSYWKIHEAVKAGYEFLGLKPRFYRVDEELPKGIDCFVFPIATDLAVENQKIAGGSQKRSRGIFLHQESLQLFSGVSTAELKKAICSGFEKVFNIKIVAKPLEPLRLKEATALSKQKYENPQAIREGYASAVQELVS